MGSLPLAKASIGSAVNDATRTTGGALGVAVLGSVLSSGYRGDMEGAPGAAHDSIAGALATGNEHLVAAAQNAFVSGMHAAAIVAAGIALAGALVALVFLPSRDAAPALVPEPAAA